MTYYYKYRLIYLSLLIWVLECGAQERITIFPSSEQNEISYEKIVKIKTGKVSSKPILVIKEPQYESKTSIVTIRERATENENEGAIEKNTDHANEKDSQHIIKEKARSIENAFVLRDDVITKKPLAFICPHEDTPVPLFSLPCFTTSNCGFLGKEMLCCNNRCIKGVKPPKADAHHEPIFFGIIQRKCPVDPLPELSEVKKCVSDEECSPRICCGEILPSGERATYCRTSIPVWDTLPLPSPVLEPLKTFTSYMQCTPPPPPHLDLYPKECQNPMDCFPNLCCQEKGKKFCRPPKKSLLALVAELGEKLIPGEAARKFIERIS